MPYTKIWIHVVWSTKRRLPVLHRDIRPLVFDHIHQNAIQSGIQMEIVNGHVDHVHCLLKLRNTQSVSRVIQILKGESAHWINRSNIMEHHFKWQRQYYAASVSESAFHRVKDYIQNQEEHHQKKNLFSEYEL